MNHVLVVQGQNLRLRRVVSLADFHVRVTWADDVVEIKDLGPLLLNHRSFNRVRNEPAIFKTLTVSEDGARLIWQDGSSLTAKAIDKLPRTAMEALEFRSIMADLHLTSEALGRMIGLSRRAITGYRSGDDIPKSVALAMRHILQRWDA